VSWAGWVLLGVAVAFVMTALSRRPVLSSPLHRWLRERPRRLAALALVLLGSSGALIVLGQGKGHPHPRRGAAPTRGGVQTSCAGVRPAANPPASPRAGVYLAGATVYGIDLVSGQLRWHTRLRGSEYRWVRGGRRWFIAAGDELYALDGATGDIRWHVRSQGPLVADSEVVYTVGDHVLSAVVAGTGQTRWSQPTDVELPAYVALDGELLVTIEGPYISVRARGDGRRIWTYALPRHSGQPPSPFPVGFRGGRVYVADASRIYSLDIEQERLCWSRPVPKGSSERLKGRQIILSSQTGQVEALDAETGTPLWHLHMPEVEKIGGSGLDAGPTLVFVQAARVIALARTTGRRQWTAPVTALSQLAVQGNYLFGVKERRDGTNARLLALDRRGRTRWSRPVGATSDAGEWGVFTYRHTVICVDERSEIHAFNARTGRPTWTLQMPAWGHMATFPGED
jgi:outer membrane protein assembly factor BamB